MLLGPWGKCLHQAGERVNRPSLTRELPQALKAVLQAVWA
jgi:arginine utilization protein RocB